MPYETRAHEQNLIDLLIKAGEDGLTTGELAQQIGVTPQTVCNYLNRLESQLVPIYETEGRRYAIDRAQYMQPLRLTLPQAWMLYLPLRRILRANLNRYRVVYDLLHHLATNLHPDLADAIAPEELSEPQDIDHIIPDLVEAWRTDHLVELRYQPLDKTYPSTLQVATLWFEPAVWSDFHYLIAGFKQPAGTLKIQELKLERVLAVKSLGEKFVRPSTTEFLKQIQAAWGTWGGNGVVVKLRFHNRVRLRLLETHWHPSQHVEEDNQNYIGLANRAVEERERPALIGADGGFRRSGGVVAGTTAVDDGAAGQRHRATVPEGAYVLTRFYGINKMCCYPDSRLEHHRRG